MAVLFGTCLAEQDCKKGFSLRGLGVGLRKHRQAVVSLQRRSSLPGRGAVRIEGHRRLDAAGEFRIVHWIEAALRAAHRQQRRQMAAGRATDRANMFANQLKPVGILPQPADGEFGLLDVGRKCRLAGKWLILSGSPGCGVRSKSWPHP